VVDLRRIVRVREVVEAETDGGLPGIGVDEQGTLDVEVEAALRVVRCPAAAFDRHRSLASGGGIDDRAIRDYLKAGGSQRRIVDDELPVERVGAGWQP